MRPRLNWQVWIGIGLFASSIALYAGLYAARPQRADDIFFYSFLDLAFIPISVLVVGVIIDGVLTYRERGRQAKRLKMLIAAFFSEVGTGLLGKLADLDPDIASIRSSLIPTAAWSPRMFEDARRSVADAGERIDSGSADLASIRDFLLPRRGFVLGMLQNPNLLEHEEFSELLWAVMHLADELSARSRLTGLPPSDFAHLSVDARRAYSALLREWLRHMQHLKSDYPYLFALAARTNPFDPDARVEVVA